MAPPRKGLDDGRADFHASFAPVSTPLTFVSPDVVCCAVGSSVCLWNIADGTKEYIPTTAYSISKVCANPAKGLFAFCEGGTSPQAFVYNAETRKLLFTLPNLTELELADIAFSSCGSRLYALSRATSKRLRVFSTATGQPLPGCDLELPQRFDKVAVFPAHKDRVALVRSSAVRLVSIQQSYQTYITKLLPSAVPADADIVISAYAWAPTGQFVFATRQGALVVLDGATGALLYACQSPGPIASIAFVGKQLLTAHIGNLIRLWDYDLPQEPVEDALAMLQQMPAMEDPLADGSHGPCTLGRLLDLDSIAQGRPVGERLTGQVAYCQVTPDGGSVVLTTAEGEVWCFAIPQPPRRRSESDGSGGAAGANETIKLDGAGEEQFVLRMLSWFHTHPISDAAFLGPSGRLCASCDESGRLRIWQLARDGDAKGFRMLSFTSALTSLAADPEGHLLVVGSDAGCLHLVRAPGWRHAFVADTIRLSDAGVARVAVTFHDAGVGVLVVAALLFNNKIAFLRVHIEAEDPKLDMLGFVDVGGAIEDICFHRAEFEGDDAKLLAAGAADADGTSCVWLIAAPPIEYEAAVAELSRETCPVWSMKVDGSKKPENRISAVTSFSHDPREAVVVGFAGGALKSFPAPTSFGASAAKQAPAEAIEAFPPQGQLITRVVLSEDGRFLVSASMDGSVRRIPIEEGTKVPISHKLVHNPYNGGVAQVAVDPSGLLFLSTGGSDGAVVWSDPRDAVRPPAPGPEEDAVEVPGDQEELATSVDDKDTAAFPLWAPVDLADPDARAGEENDDPQLNAIAMAQRRALTLEVESLRKKLRILIEQNSSCPELEQLDRQEFCVDFEERDKIAATTKERCDALRALIEKENVARQLIRDRLIKEFWDPMQGKGCQIVSLASSLAVSNYPERTVSEAESTTLRKLRVMRKTEQLENAYIKTSDCPERLRDDLLLQADQFASGDEDYVVNWWHAGSLAKDGEKEFFDQQFLYEPFELLTNCRRRVQTHMLQSMAAEFRQSFNGLFKTCQNDKKGVMDQIREKVMRIKAILVELQVEETVPEPELHQHEEEEAVLAVKDREIKAEKWISPEERKAAEEARLKEEERQRVLRENDAGTRALAQMMGGTLKTKKDLSPLEIQLDKELWMDQIPEDEMTEVQLAAFKEYKDKEKALLDEQDKYRKQLDTELKKLRSEIQELTEQFEKVLKELHHQRFAHDAKFFCQELYCVRLQLALMQSVEDDVVLKQYARDSEEAQGKLQEASDKFDEFSAEVAGKRARQDDRVRQEREAASAQNFRQQFAASGLEPEVVGTLLQLFRKKKPLPPGAAAPEDKNRRKSEGRRGSQMVHVASAAPALAPGVDPYADLGAAPVDAGADAAGQDVVLECPEGVDDASFQRMLELRRERLAIEAEVQRGAAELAEMGGLQTHYQAERDRAEEVHGQLEQELAEHVDLMKREEYDIEVLFKLKQGQVEVPQAAVVTDYSDAVIIGSEAVESRNRRILELGKDKVSTLETIKEFRKKLSLIQWEYQMLQMQTLDLEERTKDVHMLRVTKGLQSLLKGGEESRNRAEAELLDRKIEHLKSNSAQKEASLKKMHLAGAHTAKQRKTENAMLEKKLRELQQNVIQREHIRRLRAPQGGGPQGGHERGEKPKIIGGGGRIEENEAAVKATHQGFREVKTRQELMNAAKRHTEEIDLLTKELDRLRQRTFPSFVQLHEDRSPPDFRLPH